MYHHPSTYVMEVSQYLVSMMLEVGLKPLKSEISVYETFGEIPCVRKACEAKHEHGCGGSGCVKESQKWIVSDKDKKKN